MKSCFCIALILAVIAGLVPVETAMAAKKVAISKKAITLTAGKKTTLKLKNMKKSQKNKVKWTSSKKSVATVNKSGKVTAKKKGTAKITAKYAGKKYTCKVTVKAKAVKKKTPVTKEEDGFTKLTNYLKEKGNKRTDNDGSPYYTISSNYPGNTDMVGIILYDPKADYISLSEVDGQYVFELRIYPNSSKGYAYMYSDTKTSLGDVTLSLITGNRDYVNWVQSTSFEDLGDAMFRCGLLHWNMMLEEKVGIGLRDIGFTLYKAA